jgi:hypothetical protein
MSKEKEVIKEIHHYHYIPYPSYIPYGWQYPWYPRTPWSPTWVGPTDTGIIIPKITWTTTSASTTGKGTTIKYGTNINQLS